jgi:hypothetical protein
MGRAPKLLSILVTDQTLYHTSQVQNLIAQGHTVTLTVPDADIILGPNCWRMPVALVKYLPLAVRAAREVKYGKGK